MAAVADPVRLAGRHAAVRRRALAGAGAARRCRRRPRRAGGPGAHPAGLRRGPAVRGRPPVRTPPAARRPGRLRLAQRDRRDAGLGGRGAGHRDGDRRGAAGDRAARRGGRAVPPAARRARLRPVDAGRRVPRGDGGDAVAAVRPAGLLADRRRAGRGGLRAARPAAGPPARALALAAGRHRQRAARRAGDDRRRRGRAVDRGRAGRHRPRRLAGRRAAARDGAAGGAVRRAGGAGLRLAAAADDRPAGRPGGRRVPAGHPRAAARAAAGAVDLSPFAALPSPLEPWSAASAGLLTALGVAAGVVGAGLFQRRDLVGD